MTRLVHCRPGSPGVDRPPGPDTLHLWTLALDEPGPTAELGWLSAEESARAARFVAEQDRRRFVRAHAGLRSILAGYLGVAPAAVTVTTGSLGKPGLDPGRHGTALRYNLSHSHGVALVVVGSHRAVGVDVERVRPLPDLDGLVARYCAPGEQAALGRLPPDRRLEAFFTVWTLKEAYLKARGEGLHQRPESVEITLDPDDARASVRALDEAAGRRWDLFRLRHPAGHAAAVAVEVP